MCFFNEVSRKEHSEYWIHQVFLGKKEAEALTYASRR